MSVELARATFATEVADLLAALVGAAASTRLPSSGHRTSRFVWYRTPESLTLVVGAQEADKTDLALAIGLAERGDAELQLVLPAGWHEPTTHRWAWLRDDLPLRVWSHDGHEVRELARPDRDDGAALVRGAEKPQMYLGDDRTAWVADLMRWAGKNPDLDLDPGHRSGFRAWQYRGQRVLVIRRSRGGLTLVAGIDWGANSPNATPEPLEIRGPLSPEQLLYLQTAVEDGCAQRKSGPALSADEHWLQSTLRRNPRVLGLEQPVLREVPAWRPRGSARGGGPARSRGFVDLAGLDALGTIVLVETKLGGDDLLVLQGLDYRIWAQANREQLALRLDCSPTVPVEIAYCVGGTNGGDPESSRHLDAQLDALHPDIRWRLLHVTDWAGDEPPKVAPARESHPSVPTVASAVAEKDDRTHAEARAARLGSIAEVHRTWAIEVEAAAGPHAETYGYADAGEHYADVIATPEQNAAFAERVHRLGLHPGPVDADPSTARRGPAAHRLAEVTLADRDGLLVQAHWGDSGALVITGQDLSGRPFGAREYEYGIAIGAEALPLVVDALGGDEGDDLLALLGAHGEAIVARGELTWLKEIGANPEFWSRME